MPDPQDRSIDPERVLKQMVANVRDIVDEKFAQSDVVELPLTPSFDGFAISSGPGAAFVFAALVGDVNPIDKGESWDLMLRAGIASDVPYSPAIADWVNDRNRKTRFGTIYYFKPDSERDRVTVVWAMDIWYALLSKPLKLEDGNFDNPQKLVLDMWLTMVISHMTAVSNELATSFIEEFGGEYIPPTSAGLIETFGFYLELPPVPDDVSSLTDERPD